MTEGNSPARDWLRPVLMLFAALIIIPVAMIGTGIVTFNASSVNAQGPVDQRPAASTEAIKVDSRAETSQSTRRLEGYSSFGPYSATQYQPVQETQYREERVQVYQPEVDRNTGKKVYKQQEVVRRVPVTTTRFVRTIQHSSHDPKVTKLVSELRAMKDDDEEHEAKLEELRQQLESEFSKMHETQAKEIDKTAQRLDSLKQVHQQRGENKDRIVQRRVDQLLGKADALQWKTSTGTASSGPVQQSYLPQSSSPLVATSRQIAQTFPAPVRSARVGAPPLAPVAQKPGNKRTNSFQRVEVSDSVPVRPSARPQISVSASAIGEVFQLARNSANAMAELSEIQVEHDQFSRLRDSGVIPINELRKAELKLARLKREVKLNQLQLEALRESLERELKLAESTLEHAEAKLKLVELGFNKGLQTSQHRLQAQMESEKARAAYEVSQASVRQLKKAMELVEKSDESDDSSERSGESTDDAVAP
jgi:hypothetical protein